MLQIVRFLVALIAAVVFVYAGGQMTSLHSQAGNTVAELFDQYMGYFSFGMAILCVAIGLPTRLTMPPTTSIQAPAPGAPSAEPTEPR